MKETLQSDALLAII